MKKIIFILIIAICFGCKSSKVDFVASENKSHIISDSIISAYCQTIKSTQKNKNKIFEAIYQIEIYDTTKTGKTFLKKKITADVNCKQKTESKDSVNIKNNQDIITIKEEKSTSELHTKNISNNYKYLFVCIFVIIFVLVFVNKLKSIL